MRKRVWIGKIRGMLFLLLALSLFSAPLAGCGLPKASGKPWIGENAESEYESGTDGETGEDGQIPVCSTEDTPPGVRDGEEETDAGPEEPETESSFYGSAGRYVYATLDGETQKVYDEILNLLMTHGESVRVSTLDTAVLDEAYKAVTADYGEIFWASGYVYTQYTKGSERIGLDFAPSYTVTQEEREQIQARIDGEVDRILADVPMGASEYERVRYVFDYLALHVDYVVGCPENQNIISVFLYGQTVCQGYASATQYLLSRLGIQSAVVTGEAEGISHAWNLVRMDGEYYYVDTTWGNSGYAGEETALERFVNYNYFGVTSQDIALTHTANDNFVLPDCTAQTNNYYVRENRYFSEWDPDAVGALLKEGYETGDTAVSLRFSTMELYDQYLQYMIREEHIADYCTGITSVYYVEDALQRVLIFRFV